MKGKEGTLMVSISGIRGIFGDGLDAAVIVRYATAFGTWCRRRAVAEHRTPLVVVGRDARVTGPVCLRLVVGALQSTGCDVLNVDLATTPTVETAVLKESAMGGIILSASHNPAEWNALKLLGDKGIFLSPEEAREVIHIAEAGESRCVRYDAIGRYTEASYLEAHVASILDLPFIDPTAIAQRHFRVAVDGVNSVGGIAVPALLRALGLKDDQILVINGEPTGLFAHDPEPLPANLTEIIERVGQEGVDLGIVVDPDADRLALVEDGGRYVSEELTQVIAADFLLRRRPGPVVTNLSSSRALDDVAARYGVPVYRTAVGEINVVQKMHEVGAVLGGEGNGGVILPDLHYGRDALVGIAMILQHLTDLGASLSDVRKQLPVYHIAKNKIPLGTRDPDGLLERMAERYAGERISQVDGLKIDLDEGWVHLRKSNTEPIVRVYSEAGTPEAAAALGGRFIRELEELGGT